MKASSRFENSEASWKTLYFAGGVATLLVVVIFRRNWSAELAAFNGFGIFEIPKPFPSDAVGWFTLLQKDPFVGLSLFNLFDLINLYSTNFSIVSPKHTIIILKMRDTFQLM